MSYVVAAPELVNAAVGDLGNIASSIDAARSAVGGATTSVAAAGADEISEAIAALFNAHAQSFQAVSSQAAAFHNQFLQTLSTSASSYASAEATNLAGLIANPHFELFGV
ncbi:PE family protein, partial [Mycobacterium kiyosense]